MCPNRAKLFGLVHLAYCFCMLLAEGQDFIQLHHQTSDHEAWANLNASDTLNPSPFLTDIILVQSTAPSQPFDAGPSQPFDPGASGSQQFDPGLSSSSLAGADYSSTRASFLRQAVNPNSETSTAAREAAVSTIISAPVASVIASPEIGSILRDYSATTSVNVQRRSPVAFDPHVRGFRWGQIWSQASGQLWAPVRVDLDSMMSKLDPGLFQDIAVIPGPYGLRYGPGFAFIDLQLLETPRYRCGHESHFRLGSTFYENGGQGFSRASAYGGGSDWGYRIHYGSRKGSDYTSGNGTLIPSSYDSQTVFSQFGFDLSSTSKIEVGYNRLDQNDTEYALQFFDINYLGADAGNISYINTEPGGFFSKTRIDTWYNRTRYQGDNANDSKSPVVGRVRAAITASLGFNVGSIDPNNPVATSPQFDDVLFEGDTNGHRMLSGGRAVFTIGETNTVHSRIGADFRYEDQQIVENYDITINDPNYPFDDPNAFRTNLPTSWVRDAGVFSEIIFPMSSYWTARIGGRLDFVQTDARPEDLDNFGPTELSQSDTLYAFYVANDLDLNQYWGCRLGCGHSQRAPSLIDRYSDGLFLGIIQNGFSRVIGDPTLRKEELWQIDVGLDCDYDNFRGRANLFYSWVDDYITYEGNEVLSPEGARLLRTVNTDLATLAGFELYGESRLTTHYTAFSSMNYVYATDQGISAPLWGIAPLDGRAGIRLHDESGGADWGIEFAARMVSRQDRLGVIRNAFDPTETIEVEQFTPGFTIVDIRSYYNYTENISFIMGIDNLFDRNFLEHLDLRYNEQAAITDVDGVDVSGLGIDGFGPLAAFSPGFTFYTGIEINR